MILERMGYSLKNIFREANKGMCVSNSAGYHFSRFRGSRKRLYIKNSLELDRERAEAGRRLKLMGLYWMGTLLMAVGFLICFNAVFRAAGGEKISRREPAPIVSANAAESEETSEFAIIRGMGYGRTGTE
jgi:hypothetical protein